VRSDFIEAIIFLTLASWEILPAKERLLLEDSIAEIQQVTDWSWCSFGIGAA
jgi:hypothetical protein